VKTVEKHVELMWHSQ